MLIPMRLLLPRSQLMHVEIGWTKVSVSYGWRSDLRSRRFLQQRCSWWYRTVDRREPFCLSLPMGCLMIVIYKFYVQYQIELELTHSWSSESTLLPEAVSSINTSDKVSINNEFKIVWGPVKFVNVESFCPGWDLISVPVSVCVSIDVPCGSPVHCATSLFSSNIGVSIIQFAVSSDFNQINFTAVWPWTVNGILWHEPQSWPNPITCWQFSANLKGSELESERVDCCDLSTSDWVNDVVDASGSLASPIAIVCALVSWNTNISGSQELFWVSVGCECWSQVESSSSGVWVETVIDVPLELPVTTTWQSVLVSPHWLIEEIEIIFEQQGTRAHLRWSSRSTDCGHRWVALSVCKTDSCANSCYNKKTLHHEFWRNTADNWKKFPLL